MRLSAVERDLEPWRDHEAAALRSFLSSAPGRRLGVMMRGLLEAERSAAMQPGTDERLAWRCGHAAGVEHAISALDALARWAVLNDAGRPGGDDRPDDSLQWLYGLDTNARPGPDGSAGGSGSGVPVGDPGRTG